MGMVAPLLKWKQYGPGGSVIILFVLQTGVIVRGECEYTVCTTDRSHSERGGV